MEPPLNATHHGIAIPMDEEHSNPSNSSIIVNDNINNSSGMGNNYEYYNSDYSLSGNNNNDNNNNNNNNNTNNVDKNFKSTVDHQIPQKKRVKSLYVAQVEKPITFDDLGISDDTNPSEVKHQIQNHMFGFKPFKSKLTKRKLEERSPEVQVLYNDSPDQPQKQESIPILIGNYLYFILFGVFLFVIFTICSIFCYITYFGIPYGRLLWNLKGFVLWPFGKFLQLSNRPIGRSNEEREPLSYGGSAKKRRAIEVRKLTLYNYIGAFIYYVFIIPILVIFETIVFSLSWMIVVMIPTAKVHSKLLFNLLKNPLLLRSEEYTRPDCQILLYPVEAFNYYYYKYTVNGMNVCTSSQCFLFSNLLTPTFFILDLLPFVIISLIFGFFFEEQVNPIVIFVCCLLSTIPLSYYNGMAIASLSAQTSFAIGALINASFGSIIELILYVVSINGSQEEVARSALTGALLGSMLLIPGLSMIVGGIKHKEQRFNPALMGVNTILLMIAVVAAFAPTLFYKIYGSYGFNCSSCTQSGVNSTMLDCSSCSLVQNNLDDDPIYTTKARTLMYICSGILPLTYLIGLLFTLKTHTHILHGPVEKPSGHQVEYEWSKVQCIIVLLVCTTMFALVSERLVDTIDPVVSALGLTHEFLGVTILGIIPSAAEYLNAIQFSLNNNMPLALEIGASAAVQITLFQMPVLVFICAVVNHLSSNGSFTLIFPLMDFFAIFFGVTVMNLVFNNGRTNYFIGSTLVIIYLVIVFCFFFTPNV
ncbi:hypothetical protein DICPUDRAFT_45117 [Dictyostelium purpureum]|uniref:Sodium/calcium exchanger membrane region domain-containing protein n=1 Tax=Dictyostelium purpureum TaxID=5786 RepID=F0Z8Z6_DICPU|nr:uncharacterized protein DICPUDRAFT_45117 [Dictyostelium purpureum]EGC39571.1 hypothetical protein DICPUDRAFT_45117 [Dictyostelium purpureum]|eukprot:XP_003283906.1 hypothetical protein DICPUDRAFT_45117 [Dictyostelium purpureum]